VPAPPVDNGAMDAALPPFAIAAPRDGEPAASLRATGRALLTSDALCALVGAPAPRLAALGSFWNDLPPDAHLRDGGRYRHRRHGSFVQDLSAAGLEAVPHRAHWQPTTYNALHGGLLRWFEPLQPALAADDAFIALTAGLGRVFAQVRAPAGGRWFIEAHAFRIDTRDGVGRPTPEGAHRDGVDFVAVVLVSRGALRGGETRVFEADGPHGVRFTLGESWSALLLDDTRVIHETTPIQPLLAADGAAAATTGQRDTLVLTYRGDGFQDPLPG
jgi:hypothetical protein